MSNFRELEDLEGVLLTQEEGEWEEAAKLFAAALKEQARAKTMGLPMYQTNEEWFVVMQYMMAAITTEVWFWLRLAQDTDDSPPQRKWAARRNLRLGLERLVGVAAAWYNDLKEDQ